MLEFFPPKNPSCSIHMTIQVTLLGFCVITSHYKTLLTLARVSEWPDNSSDTESDRTVSPMKHCTVTNIIQSFKKCMIFILAVNEMFGTTEDKIYTDWFNISLNMASVWLQVFLYFQKKICQVHGIICP